jgi:hypothetical protein
MKDSNRRILHGKDNTLERRREDQLSRAHQNGQPGQKVKESSRGLWAPQKKYHFNSCLFEGTVSCSTSELLNEHCLFIVFQMHILSKIFWDCFNTRFRNHSLRRQRKSTDIKGTVSRDF